MIQNLGFASKYSVSGEGMQVDMCDGQTAETAFSNPHLLVTAPLGNSFSLSVGWT